MKVYRLHNGSNRQSPLYQLTVSEFQNLLISTIPKVEIKQPQLIETSRKKINGIRGLAKFLDVSTPTAQRLKNEKKVQAYCTGNKYYFFSDEINASLKTSMK